MTETRKLLEQYTETGSEPAFRELVARYLDLVYSAAVRLMDGDVHLAEDVAQTVFADLAQMARKLSPEVMLGGWLHRHTCYVAAGLRRGERRRQLRERQAVEMNMLQDHSEANLSRIAPILDDAINQLGAEDRAAILLRFFEQSDFRSIGRALDTNEDAAQKRVSRALEKLHGLLRHRGVAFSVTALGTVLAAEAVTAAPAGLALGISTSALAGAAGTGTTLTLIKIMTATQIKIAVLGAVVVAVVATPLVIQHQANLHRQNETLRQQLNEASAVNERLSNQVAQAAQSAATGVPPEPGLSATAGANPYQSAAPTGASTAAADPAKKTNDTSILAGMTLDPGVRKLIRDQQKTGMTMIYKDFAKQLDLTKEQTEHLSDLLADDVMDNIDQITKVLREGKSADEMKAVFAEQDAALQAKVKAALGDEGFAHYQEYSHNLLSTLTTDQFKATLTGDNALTDDQVKLFKQVLQEETEAAIARAGLDPGYQAVPILNFRNIASEEFMNQSLALLDEIYQNASSRAIGFLNTDALAKFSEFRTNAMNMSRMSLVMNRKVMAPGAQ